MREAGASQLDDQQLAAVEHTEGPLEVIAGPGAGKTLLLVERVARLYERGTPLSGIVLVTFTTRAAGEMRHRLQMRLGLDLDRQTLRNASTIHALAYRILRAAKKRTGQSGWRVADENEAFEVLRQAMVEAGAPKELYTPIDMARRIENLQGLPEGPASIADEAVAATHRRYRQILAARRRWDLGELIPGALGALRQDEDLAGLFRGLCLHLMVDEWQDVSIQEYEFLKQLLRGDDIFVVGSPAQSIYEWRHAHYAALASRFREDFPDLETLILQRNYRSTHQIVAASASVLASGYVEANLTPVRGEGPPVRMHLAYDPDAEASLVAGLLEQYHEQEALPYQEMAVLFREWRQSATVEQALAAKGIPYSLGDRLRFYERPEVREIVAYLALARSMARSLPAEMGATGALESVINVPPRGIGPNSLNLLRGGHPRLDWRLFFAGMVREDIRPQVREGCRALFELLAGLCHRVEEAAPAELIDQLIEESGYRAWLEEDFAAGRRMYAVEALQREAATYNAVAAFLRTIYAKMGTRNGGGPADRGVTLSSIHGAKGLEWPVVTVIGLYEGSLPHVREQNESAAADPPGERRLAYVALSRAAECLHLTAPRHIEAGGHLVAVSPSRYLGELSQATSI